MRYLDLMQQPIVFMKGDFAYKTENAIVFPQIKSVVSYDVSLLINNFIDGVMLNETPIVVVKELIGDVLYIGTTLRPIISFAGLVKFGDIVYCFHEGNKCTVISSTTTKTVNLTLNGSSIKISHVYQLNPYLFAVVAVEPTTVFIYSMNEAGDIALKNDGETYDLPAYSYATYSHPKQRPRLVRREDSLFLVGEDATVELDIEARDLIYIRTVQSYNQPVNPYEDLASLGLIFLRETLNFFLFKNTINNCYVWFSKGDNKIFFSTNTIYLSNSHAIYDRNIYTLSHEFKPELGGAEVERSFFVKFKQDTLLGVYVNVLESVVDDKYTLSIRSRFLEAENTYTYSVTTNQHTYRMSLRGEEFILGVITKHGLRLAELKVW